jgi:ATP-dependent DNA helicase RecQ
MSEPKPGIVYAATRKETEKYAAELVGLGLRAAAYHAGMKKRDRESAQDGFMADELDVIVATTAFGMGIDKPNVRFVVHASVADSVDSYYQEIGRAGRDGDPARALLLYRPEDLGLRRYFAGGVKPREDLLTQLAAAIAADDEPIGRTQLRDATGMSARRLTSLLNLLQEVGAVRAGEDNTLVSGDLTDAEEAAHRAIALAEARERMEKSRVEMMRAYAETTGCRRQALLGYFGEVLDEPCGRCDNCNAGVAIDQPASNERSRESPYAVNAKVRHAEWGPGVVMSDEGDRIVVLFEQVGYKTLALGLLRDSDILEIA